MADKETSRISEDMRRWLGSGVPTKAIEILESPGNHNVTIIDERFWVD
jgi:hypothetical protein